ncbi:hypothetical protein MKW98_020911 [Papaver atlanticum]|uniref:MADS-box domain-containing protein n=1 Tax=Papaver atlanticum TaxID=357466 RepID=A0AAD4TGK0_9MAGN|nr:hypothetical protein MKW98_020911 [Papaver atlanticum]
MGRAKLKLELIAKEKSRNSTYSKRKIGLRKKLHEFKTLCGVDTLMIAYGPKQGDRPVEVETFPQELDKVNEIIQRYQQVPREDKDKRTLTLKNFFEDQKRKSEAELVELRKKNRDLQHISLDDLVTVDQLQQLYHSLNVKMELVEQRIKSMKAMNSSGVMDGSNKIAEFPNSIARDQIPYQNSNTYNNHDDTLWRREDILHSQSFGYPLPAMEYHHLNNIPTTKDYPTPAFAKPMIGTYGSNYGYLGNQYYLDSSYATQHMGSTMMSTASMYHPLGQIPPGVSFQMPQQQFQFMNTPQTHHQHQFMSSGSSSQMLQQSPSSHLGFQDQTDN